MDSPRWRPSDFLSSPILSHDSEIQNWCVMALSLWKSEPRLLAEFLDVADFLDFCFFESARLIRSAHPDYPWRRIDENYPDDLNKSKTEG